MTLRVALIGTGWVADKHVAALQRLPGVQLVAVAGRNEARVHELAAPSGAKAYAYAEVTRMLQSERLDAVFLLLPPHLHGDIEARCAEHVPAVLIEKPIGVDLDQARRTAELFEKADTLVSVGFMCRYRQTSERVRHAFAAKGEQPIVANGFWVGDVPGPRWWRTRAQSGGQFVEQCAHLVDLSRYLVGDIDEVSAFATKGFVTELDGYDVDDAAVVNVRFQSGAIGNFTTGCFIRPEHTSALGIGLTLQGRSLQAELKGWDLHLTLSGKPGQLEQQNSPEPDIFAVENAAFFAAIRSKDRASIRSSYRDAIATLQVGLAAERSIATNRPVSIAAL